MKLFIAKLIGLYFNILALFAPRVAGRKGFYLFSTPMRTKVLDHHRTFLDSAENFTFSCDGNMLHAYRWGTGPKVILFLHGWQSQSFRWKKYIEALSPNEFTVYTFDAPAHGQSSGRHLNLAIYSNAIEEFIRQIQPVHTIVGHSLGGFAALHSYYRLESLPVKQMVILGTPGEARDFVRLYQEALGLSTRSIRAIRSAFKRIIFHLPEYYSASRFAGALNIPGLIIHDEQDREAPYHHALEIHHAWRSSRLITTQGLGHNLRSEAVVAEVVDFIEEKKNHVSALHEFASPLHLN